MAKEWDESKHPRDELGRWATIKGHLATAARIGGIIAIAGAASAASQALGYKVATYHDKQRKRDAFLQFEERARYEHEVDQAVERIQNKLWKFQQKQASKGKPTSIKMPTFYNTEVKVPDLNTKVAQWDAFKKDVRGLETDEREAKRLAKKRAQEAAEYNMRGFYDFSRDKK